MLEVSKNQRTPLGIKSIQNARWRGESAASYVAGIGHYIQILYLMYKRIIIFAKHIAFNKSV